LKNTVLLITALCCAALFSSALAAENATTPEFKVLNQDSGTNISKMNLSLYSVINDFGLAGLGVGEAVKFTAPKASWKIYGVLVMGWSEYNNTTKTLPVDRNILVEIRDKDLNLLYKFADAQNNYFLSMAPVPVFSGIEIPALPVTGDFYVVFYDRGAMALARENVEGNSSSFFYPINGQLVPAQFRSPKTNETIGTNWMIRVIGK